MHAEPSPPRVLVVDDDARNRLVAQGHLESMGYKVLLAEGGVEALELFGSDPADLVLLDVLMPGMDGFETCQRLRGLPRGEYTPIVLLTALGASEVQANANAAGADDLLSKPICALELQLRVRSLLRIRKLQAQIATENATGRVAAESRAARSEHLYRALFDGSNDAVVVHEPDGRLIEANARAAELLGYDREELVGLEIAQLHTPAGLEAGRAHTVDLEAKGRAVFEVELARKDGSALPSEVAVTRMVLDGQPLVQGCFRDTSARKRAEAELARARESEKAATDLLRVIGAAQEAFIAGRPIKDVFEDLLPPILELTRSEYGFLGEVRFGDDDAPYLVTHALSNVAWDDEAMRLFEQQRTEGLTFRNLNTLFGAVLTTRRPVISNQPATDPRSGGLPHGHPPLKSFLGLPFFKGKTMVGMVGVANRPGGYDDTVVEYLGPFRTTCANIIEAHRSEERRLASERALRESEAQLQQTRKLESLGALSGGIAHDFNNILGAIISFAGFVHDDLHEGDPRRDDLVEVLNAAERGTRLTKQLLAFSRQSPTATQPIDLNRALEKLLGMLQRSIGEDVEVEVVPSERAAVVRMDPVQLDQLVLNLAVNARDAMPDGGRLRIAIAHPAEPLGELTAGKAVRMTVTDDGCGMDVATLARVFDPFFTTKPVGKGTGLGLATCFAVVKAAGGTVTVESAPGEGSTFTIDLPACDEAVEADEAPTSSDTRGSEERVLVVEDDDALRSAAARILESAGYQVSQARDGNEALARLSDPGRPFALIVTDVVMPGCSGYAVKAHARKHMPDAAVVLTSGYLDGRAGPDAGEDGAPFLWKPYTPSGLLRAVHRALTRARSNPPANATSRVPPEGAPPVLIIDDDGPVRAVFERILRRAGYDVVTAENLGAAKAALEGGQSYAAVLCDLTLGEDSGAGLLAWLRERRPELMSRVMIVTGGVISDEAQRLIATGAVQLVRKPVDPAELLDWVGAVARRPGGGDWAAP